MLTWCKFPVIRASVAYNMICDEFMNAPLAKTDLWVAPIGKIAIYQKVCFLINAMIGHFNDPKIHMLHKLNVFQGFFKIKMLNSVCFNFCWHTVILFSLVSRYEVLFC